MENCFPTAKMRTQLKGNQDSQIIRRFVGWGEMTRSALRKGKPVPNCSKFVLTSFVHKLCSIHRNRMLPDETGTTIKCDNHHYLYIALRLTYDFRVTIKSTVSMLLREIFLCEGSLEAIFSILLQAQSSTRSVDVNINTYTLYSTLGPLYRSAVEYFVKSICPLGRDVRETEETVYTPENVLNKKRNDEAVTPLMAATRSSDPELVLLLLRYGADPLLSCKADSLDYDPKPPVGFAVNGLNICMFMKHWAWMQSTKAEGGSSSRSAAVQEVIDYYLKCLSYFSRAVYALDIRVSGATMYPTRMLNPEDNASNYMGVLPDVSEILDLTVYRRPPSLRHACRCAIRGTIRLAGRENIPTAIKMLPVPKLLQQFLNLKS